MIARAVVAGLCALVAGCKTCDAPKVVRVDVPVSVPCAVALPPRPEMPTDTLAPDAGIWTQMAALRAERLRLRAHVATLEAALQGCR